LEDWQTPFFAYIEAARAKPFAWGVNDCCLFTAGAVDALTGSTYAAQVAANYTDEASALAYLASFDSFEAAISHWADAPSLAPNFAGPGDIVLIDTRSGPTAGVCLGVHCAFVAPGGLAYLPRVCIARCWRI
jgi:hypothetical protein